MYSFLTVVAVAIIAFLVGGGAGFGGGVLWSNNAITKHPGRFEAIREKVLGFKILAVAKSENARTDLEALAREIETKAAREAQRVRAQIVALFDRK